MSEQLLNNVGRPSRLKGWKPKKWRPEYERMVAMSCVGWSNKMIAEKTGYTPVHVSTILNLDEAEVVRSQLLEKMREKTLTDIPGELEEIAQLTVKRIKRVLTDDGLFDKSPFQVIDRGTRVLEGLGYLGKGVGASPGGISVAGNAVILQGQQADSLADALNRANQVREIHAPKQIAGEK